MFSTEETVLILLREQQGKSSTAEDRVIGAGLKALDKLPNGDGAAAKELFCAFAVTQEDFVHPMPVIELLWWSCCAQGVVEKQEGSMTARLKVRQRTQLLVDHSLLLGSSSDGVHLHDIVLSYLRKRLLAAVEMLIAARERQRSETTGMDVDDAQLQAAPPPKPMLHNSTSSLYIDSTISKPDLSQLSYCVSLLVYDLIVEGEASHAAKLAAGIGTSPNPLRAFQPKQIFTLTKRSRERFTDGSTRRAFAFDRAGDVRARGDENKRQRASRETGSRRNSSSRRHDRARVESRVSMRPQMRTRCHRHST